MGGEWLHYDTLTQRVKFFYLTLQRRDVMERSWTQHVESEEGGGAAATPVLPQVVQQAVQPAEAAGGPFPVLSFLSHIPLPTRRGSTPARRVRGSSSAMRGKSPATLARGERTLCRWGQSGALFLAHLGQSGALMTGRT